MAENGRRQFVKYNFFKVDPQWRRLDHKVKTGHKEEFAAVVDETASTIFSRTFSLVGLRGDTDFLLWQAADDLESIQDSATRMWSTGLGSYLTQPYSYLSMTRRSQYVSQHKHAGQEGTARAARRLVESDPRSPRRAHERQLSSDRSFASSRSETALFRNLCVELRIGLCDVPEYASAQILALLDLAKNDSDLIRERAAPVQAKAAVYTEFLNRL